MREAAAREALGGPFWGPAALEAALAAQQREPSASSRQTVVRLALKAAGGVRLKDGAPPLLPGTVPCAGDIEALCWTGDSVGRALRRCYQSEDRWVKSAALLQLAVLAAAPEHKAFFAAGGIQVLGVVNIEGAVPGRHPGPRLTGLHVVELFLVIHGKGPLEDVFVT